MKNIAIFGAGGFGTEVAAMLRIINDISPEWNLVGFYVDSARKERRCRISARFSAE